jgi:hypothetical protein
MYGQQGRDMCHIDGVANDLKVSEAWHFPLPTVNRALSAAPQFDCHDVTLIGSSNKDCGISTLNSKG